LSEGIAAAVAVRTADRKGVSGNVDLSIARLFAIKQTLGGEKGVVGYLYKGYVVGWLVAWAPKWSMLLEPRRQKDKVVRCTRRYC